MRRAALFPLLALCALAIVVPVAAAAPAEFAGSSVDGTKIFFTTAAQLVPGDTDNGFVDLYERFHDPAPGIETEVTREISTGPTGGNDSNDVSFDAVSEDGFKVFFSTAEPLVEEDKDHSRDIYQRNTVTGETTLVSGGSPSCSPCGNGESPVTFVGATPTGAKVFFTTSEGLTGVDVDGFPDVYAREPGVAAPILATPGGTAPATFLGASADGSRVVFETTDKLAGADADSESDIYQRELNSSTTKLVSAAGICPSPLAPQECAPIYRATAAGGSVVFETKAQLTGDSDKFQDVYEWSPSMGLVSLVSTGSEGEEGKGEKNAVFAGLAAEGDKVFFETEERLSASDGDSVSDVYERVGGSTVLVTPGNAAVPASFNAASPDGTTIFFSTTESLTGGDLGEKLDVYERRGVTTKLASAGSAGFDSTFADASSDALHVFYVTSQKLDAADDLDSNPDIYEWTEGSPPALVSTGSVGGNDVFTPHLFAVSEDGGHAVFSTRERLAPDDNFAAENDVYDRTSGETLLVSAGNSAQLQLGPPSPSLIATNPTSPGISTEPLVLGQAEGGTLIKLYATADCSGATAATGTAAELNGSGIKAIVKAGSTTTFHATATNTSGDTSGCSSGSVTYVQQSSPPPPEGEPGGGSSPGGGSGSGGATTPSSGSNGSSSGGGSDAAIKIGNFVYVAPLTRITFAPAAKTRSRRPVFQFVDAIEQPNTHFFCRIDKQPWKACSSPYTVKRLSLRHHVFAVKGKSFAGQWEAHPVVRRFKVVGR